MNNTRCYKCKELCGVNGLKYYRIPLKGGGYYYDIENQCVFFEFSLFKFIFNSIKRSFKNG